MPDTVLPAAPPESAVIALLDRLHPGDWLAFASGDAPLGNGIPTLRVDAPLERVAGDVLRLLPISRHTLHPLLVWTTADTDPGIVDLTYAMQGLASDGSGRRMTATAIDDALLQHGADTIDAAIRVPWPGVPFLYIVCVGGGVHLPTDLATPQRALAEVC